MPLRQYTRILRRGWPLILLLGMAGAGLGWTTGGSSGPIDRARYYRAIVTLSSTRGADPEGNAGVAVQRSAVTAVIGPVPERAAAAAGESQEQFLGHINVTADTTLDLLQITSVGTDRTSTAKRAEALSGELLGYQADLAALAQQRGRDRSVRELDDLRGRIEELDGRLARGAGDPDVIRAERDALVNQYRLAYERFQQLAADGPPQGDLVKLDSSDEPEVVEISAREYASTLEGGPLRLPDGARKSGSAIIAPGQLNVTSPAPTGDRRRLRAALGGSMGVLLGAVILVARVRLDTKIRSSDDAEDAFELPVLAEIPAAPRHPGKRRAPSAFTNPLSQTAEGYRRVRASILHLQATRRARDEGADPAPGLVVLVTSSERGDHTATAVANLAAVLAEGELEVLVIGDFRRQRLPGLLGIDGPTGGLPESAADGGARPLPTLVPGVSIIPGASASGTVSNPAHHLDTERAAVERARLAYDVVVLDTAPLLVTSDAIDLLSVSDLVVLVASAGRTTREAANEASELLERLGAPVAGVVLLGTAASKADREFFQPGLRRDVGGAPGPGRARRSAEPRSKARRKRLRSGRSM